MANKSGKKYLRFYDLRERGIVLNRATLANWIRDRGFPTGVLIGPNSRIWDEGLVLAWLAQRPTGRKPVPRRKAQPDEIPLITD